MNIGPDDVLLVVNAVERLNGNGTVSSRSALERLEKLDRVGTGQYALGLIAELESRLQDAEARIRGLETSLNSNKEADTVAEIVGVLSRNGYFRGPTAG